MLMACLQHNGLYLFADQRIVPRFGTEGSEVQILSPDQFHHHEAQKWAFFVVRGSALVGHNTLRPAFAGREFGQNSDRSFVHPRRALIVITVLDHSRECHLNEPLEVPETFDAGFFAREILVQLEQIAVAAPPIVTSSTSHASASSVI